MAALLLVTPCLLAQKNSEKAGFFEGYIIRHRMDTLYGQVKDRSAEPYSRLYSRIRFRRPGFVTSRFGPARIEGYRRGLDIYQSIWLKRDRKFLMEKFISRHGIGKKEFMKVVVPGYLTLYYFEFNEQESHTIDHIPLLKRQNEDYMVRVTQGILGLKKQQLYSYFADCPALGDKIRSGELKTPIEIAVYYNNWWHSIDRK